MLARSVRGYGRAIISISRITEYKYVNLSHILTSTYSLYKCIYCGPIRVNFSHTSALSTPSPDLLSTRAPVDCPTGTNRLSCSGHGHCVPIAEATSRYVRGWCYGRLSWSIPCARFCEFGGVYIPLYAHLIYIHIYIYVSICIYIISCLCFHILTR